jgi:hypothetical protein
MHVVAGMTMFVLCLSVCTTTSSAALVWEDNFDDENLDGWTITGYESWSSLVTITGNFSAEGGALTCLDDDINVARHDSTTNVGTWSFDMFVPDDGEGVIDVMFMSNGSRPYPDHFGSLFMSVEAWIDHGRFDFWMLRGTGNGVLFDQFVPAEFGGWHHFDVTRESNGQFNLFHNGTFKHQVLNNDVATSTYFEVWCGNASGAMIDNIVVDDEITITRTTTTTDDGPTPPPTPIPWDLIAIVGGVGVVVIMLAIVCLKRR